MLETTESGVRCSACGNVLANGRCPRCEANAFTRQRRWRTGDRGANGQNASKPAAPSRTRWAVPGATAATTSWCKLM